MRPMLDEFVAYHTRLPATDRALDPTGTDQERTISGDLADLVINLTPLARRARCRRVTRAARL